MQFERKLAIKLYCFTNTSELFLERIQRGLCGRPLALKVGHEEYGDADKPSSLNEDGVDIAGQALGSLSGGQSS